MRAVKLKRVRLAGDGATSVAALRGDDVWVPLAPLTKEPWGRDLLALLGGGDELREEVRVRIREAEPAETRDGALLPFAPRSLRAFSIYPKHMEQSARVLVKRFFPRPAALAVGAYERVTRRTFPAVKPKKAWFEQPAFYVGNHTAFITDGDELPWPGYTDFLDFELELGFVLAGEDGGIGGFFLVNDWSARDVQAHEYRNTPFGPVVKAKTFNNSIGDVVVTADELEPKLRFLRARVRVNGDTWSETTTADAAFEPKQLVAHAGNGERLAAGDVFAMGTLPNGCGMELDRWLKPGDEVSLEVDGIGTLTNRVGLRG